MLRKTIVNFIGVCLLLSWVTCLYAQTLTNMQVNAVEGNRICIQLTMSEPVEPPKSFATDNPSRIILDFPGVSNGLSREQARPPITVGVLNKIAAVQSGERTRVVIDLKETVPFSVETQGNDIVILLSGTLPSTKPPSEPFRGQVYTPAADVPGGHKLCSIDFRRGPKGEGRVIIDMNDPNIPIDLKEEAHFVRLRFADTLLPPELQHKLDVTDFGTPVTTVNTIREGKDIIMTIQVAGFSENIAYQADKRFTLEVRPLTKEEKEDIQSKTFKYTGERLSLNFQDIEVRAVLQLIADFTGLNIVTSDTVTGSVTLRLKNVPWDEALDIILKTKGLSKREVGDVLMIGPSEEMAGREKQELQSKQQVQDLAPIRAEYIEVNYAKAADLAALLKTDKNSLLSHRGTVSVDERTNTLLVQDTYNKLEEVRALVTRLDVPVRQVMIESRIVFANDDFEDELGVNLRSAAKFRPGQEPVVGFSGNNIASDAIAQGSTPASQSLGDRLNVNLLGSGLPSGAIGSAQFGLSIAKLPGGTILDLELLALENEGCGKIVASPRLITSNQQLAYIESGEEIPYQEASSSGATSVSFKKAVLRLEVIPQITPDDHIILDLKVNQDSRGIVTAGVPAINTRQMATKVLVANGETVVLGGIYQQNKASTQMQVPFFGKLPVVGWMFKNETNSDQRTELLIFVTPKIIQDGMAA
jgi:type IV pilus assembly protein PilQ